MESSQPLKLGHAERTAEEPRDLNIHEVIISEIDQVNERIRLYRLSLWPGDGLEFLPGQWLDVFVPDEPSPGGFTITSPPSIATGTPGYLELAIQKSPDNRVAQWLWRPTEMILGSKLKIRVGGSFVWPPSSLALASIKRAVFIAGGVGINPLMSILSYLGEEKKGPSECVLLYSTKVALDGGRTLFLDRAVDLFASEKLRGQVQVFLTGLTEDTGLESHEGARAGGSFSKPLEMPRYKRHRILTSDLLAAAGTAEERPSTVVYICGPPGMTDEFVGYLTSPAGGMGVHQVTCEKWW